jgi:hypothetical protein
MSNFSNQELSETVLIRKLQKVYDEAAAYSLQILAASRLLLHHVRFPFT